jgi:GNAT superfamily N-acetyltransferase
MITASQHTLSEVPELFDEIAQLGNRAVGDDVDHVRTSLKTRAKRGAFITLLKDGERIIGSIVTAPLAAYDTDLKVKLAVAKKGVAQRDVALACHIYLEREFWGQGMHSRLLAERDTECPKRGFKYVLIYGAATDQLQAWCERFPNLIELNELDGRGHKILLRPLETT